MYKEFTNSTFRGRGRGSRLQPQRFGEPSTSHYDEWEEWEYTPRLKPTKFRPKQKTSIGPPRQGREGSTSDPPKPQHLSTTSTGPKNDPLYKESISGREPHLVTVQVHLYPGLHAIDELVNQVHSSVSAIDYAFSLRVPVSALAYYVAATVYARVLKALDMCRRPEEDKFMWMIYDGKYDVPAIIGYYMDGIGNTELNGRNLWIRAKPRTYVRSADDRIGWFGKITNETHYLYASYPCLAVYLQRIQSDIKHSNHANVNPIWKLPDNIASEDAEWLYRAGFNEDGDFDSSHPVIPCVSELLAAVQAELTYTTIKLTSMNSENRGSLAQTVTTRVISGERETHCTTVLPVL
ncbi:uncharacterized protein LOC128882147 [Hylaeus volcanicus]|uniref:uncharacterized protein LOC128882147 n=1 Tax=Hylaeus volcanicus TaxID=313075 RepID=UPI0023B8003C|nr:uncharacterized protein LOC128882147 [Hylaeus volcanicus]